MCLTLFKSESSNKHMSESQSVSSDLLFLNNKGRIRTIWDKFGITKYNTAIKDTTFISFYLVSLQPGLNSWQDHQDF
jgi:hypothetical protein